MVELVPPPRFVLPSFRYPQTDVSTFKRIWRALDIISPGAPASSGANPPPNPSPKTITRRSSQSHNITAASSGSKTPKKASPLAMLFASLPSLEYNLSNLQHFQAKLCAQIYQLELEASGCRASTRKIDVFDLVRLAPAQLRAIETNYQVVQMLQLIAILIDCLEFNRLVPEKYLDYTSHVNGRVFALGRDAYKLFGEALILTVIESLAEKSQSNSLVLTLEEHVSFNLFISDILNYMILQNNDAHIKTPVVVPAPFTKKIPTNVRESKVYAYENPPRGSCGEISIKSSRLSLYSPSELDYDLSFADEVTIAKSAPRSLYSEETVTDDYAVDAGEDEVEDDAYTYLNSFDEQPVVRKKGRLSFFRRKSIVDGSGAKLAPSLSIRSRR
ncbi:uncharacterized protein CANTADRAFT_23191 [Suhomyces tanzawaensis NRRL Y-17324]|uniref:Uncharacterized protein n=1 Tax=Suhomyces tanzawaensis NRRL Y-17324 TaxID=984487 RepID=A0A1E4SEZ5_9ASCO|nr:uncharacterized protein CANTADRAFT_23191 [Suhomyces tanzawaensis NRRL Y-17324]ODV78087.1 hypothetical protein CANTADRAFT_23191 [Suhomyces tanzawaensis NRRL Y-17324]